MKPSSEEEIAAESITPINQSSVKDDEHRTAGWVGFLAVHNSSIGHLVPWSVTTNNQTLQSDPRDL